ncbi:restriction system protein [Nonomuraea jiangxiensis]|uniref:Restriction system protein n=2 Tax=Nonomuraea jiangxiensis TaxID=633440 RepID=A0A1G8FB27_9ACTN|nr:restriction system protein [Nonomuraea jiangxiensis]
MPIYLLDEWRAIMRHEVAQPSPDYVVIAFPDDRIRDEYLLKVSDWPEMEIRRVLANMIGESRGANLIDKLRIQTLKAMGPGTLHPDGSSEPREFSDYERRLILALAGKGSEPVWPGLTWVLDLLPHFPRDAINALSAFLLAHAQTLPDLRIDGLSDAMTLIRYRYIIESSVARNEKVALLHSLDPRDIELLASALYSEMGYEVHITDQQKDGGFDAVAKNEQEIVYIECKNWVAKVDVATVRSFAGVVFSGEATRGVLISVSGFTDKGPMTAIEWVDDPMRRSRIKLWSGEDFVQMLNEHLGVMWHSRVDRIIANQRRFSS